MKNESLPLLKSKNEYLLFILLISFVALFNIFYEYSKFKQITQEELYKSSAVVLNSFEKTNCRLLKLQSDNYTFYTKVDLGKDIKKFDRVEVIFISKHLTFFQFLKGFFVKIIDITKIEKENSIRYDLALKIKSNHTDSLSTELFQALFLAYPISKELREFCTALGISHLVAISGFHLSVLSLCLYFIFNALYSPIHQKYFNYRNKKFDILLISLFFLFSYLLLTNIVPSLLRAFTMLLLAFFLLRFNIKLFSFNTLLLTLLFILALFPKYIFSLGLWFSLAGVFYIYLFIQYFKELQKLFAVLFFNFWIFFVLNPIVHYFFYNTTYEQLLSPLVTLLFTIFYPLELLLHILGQGGLLDEYLIVFLSYKMNVFDVQTPFWFFVCYVVVSFIAIKKKWAFIVLNSLLVGFNIYLYL